MAYKKLCWTEADVQCPFYLSDDRESRSITCEGCCVGQRLTSRFRTLQLREKHMGRFCVSDFTRCPLYRCTYANKYEDKP